ncbi:hypothetical protein HPB50_020845 [Hyalomma asiaticum]|uniref:Uncharacterized protein n=1 Tax=Hyalomma asiaticum TaxID=266040 RepID=A0ACB7RYA3_HYAAI|nr:hypothetical protein HPB50_020845 [Hyalomma asiaticum]
MKANAKSATAARYKKEWIYDCLLLKIKSTAVYTFLHENEFLPLPNPRTLYGYLRNLKADFGFDSTLFTVLCEKLKSVPERERRGVLMFDEMSVRKSVHIRESDMALLGKVDFAEHTRPGDHGKDGDHVLVFLFRPFLGGWSQTVGTFCASGAAPGSIVAKLLLQCIVHLTNAGVVVDAVTCDNSTSNQSALRSLGVNGDMHKLQTCFENPCEPSKQVHVVIDPPHIFKCIRNNLLKVGKFLLPQGQEVFHCHYKDLLDYEEGQAGLRAVPKLTKAHIFPNAFQKMSVKLAVQASHARSYAHESTASAMEFYSEQEDCKKLHGSAATSQFTRTLNKLFDCLNSCRPDHVRFNEAQHIAVLKDSIAWLDNWEKYIKTLPTERQVCFLSKQTCGALRLTLHSSVALIENLLLSGFRYVLVGNFGQDPLERFFGIVRHVAGDGGQPTVQHFLFIYRMLSVNNLVRPPKRASVEGDGPQLLLKLQGLFDKGKPASSQVDMLAVLFDDVLEEPGEAVNNASVPDVTLSTKECILDYLAGYVITMEDVQDVVDLLAAVNLLNNALSQVTEGATVSLFHHAAFVIPDHHSEPDSLAQDCGNDNAGEAALLFSLGSKGIVADVSAYISIYEDVQTCGENTADSINEEVLEVSLEGISDDDDDKEDASPGPVSCEAADACLTQQ